MHNQFWAVLSAQDNTNFCYPKDVGLKIFQKTLFFEKQSGRHECAKA
jgi:hypothetical protein